MDSASGREAASAGSEFDFPRLCRYLSERSPQPMVAVEGLSHIVRYLNPAFSHLVGKPSADLIGRPFGEAVPEGEENGCLGLLERVYRTGTHECLAEQEHRQDPTGHWSYSVWPIVGSEDRPTGVMIQVTDVAEAAAFRRRSVEMNEALLVSAIRQHELTATANALNSELNAATQAKSQFLATMSHEIRTPLTAIMGFLELLSTPGLSESDRQNYRDRIQRNAETLLRLINDILDLSKVEAGKLETERVDVNLPALLADVAFVMRHLAKEKGLPLTLTVASPLPETILSDPTRLKQILTNVIGNAVKFTEVGAVTVSTRVDPVDKQLHILVSDTGAGMTSEQSAKLFQPFAQGDATITRKFGGTGLGLDLARRLARMLSGDIILRESAPGMGSVFEITLSLEDAKYHTEAPLPALPDDKSQRRLDGVRVLLVEDTIDNQVLATKLLSLAGASVDVANDGEAGVATALSGNYDVVLMDIQMPKLNGFEATARLRRQGYHGPIVALTAHAMREEIERCRLVGYDAHLSKPFSKEALVEIVHRMVDDRRA